MKRNIILICCVAGLWAFSPLRLSAVTAINDDNSLSVSAGDSKVGKKPATKVTVRPVAPQTNNKEEKPLGPVNPNIRPVVSDKNSMFQITKENNDWFFMVPDTLVGRLLLAVTRFTTTPAGFSQYGGEQVRQQTVYFEMAPDGKSLFLKSSILYNKADTLDAIHQAVSNSSADPIIQAFKLLPGAPKDHYKINVGDFLLSDNSFSLDKQAKGAMGIGIMMGGSSYIESVHSYPINVEVKTVRTFMSNADRLPASYATSVVSLGLNTSFVLLPKEPMRARIFDPRVGYFTDDYYVFSDHEQKVKNKRFITRWRLEPKTEDIEKMKRGELVEPKKQIVYYIDPATPKQWRPYLIAGINDWNKAFEQAGFKNAIAGKEWPDSNKDMSLEDARFAVIRYLASPIANAYGPQVHDPRSGEIIESHVGWYHNVMTLVHDWFIIQTANVDKRARNAKFDEELMGQLIRFVSSHEIGHTLGLRHNFGSSSTVPVEKLRDKAWVAVHGHTPSIMDYARFNYVAQPEDGMTEEELFPRINDYDKWAIQWGYSPEWNATDAESDRFFMSRLAADSLQSNPRLWWGDGEGYRFDPRRQTEDLGDDAVKASEYGIKNLKAEIPHFQEWSYWGDDTSESNLRSLYENCANQLLRYCGHVVRNLFGFYVNTKTPDDKGDVYQQTPREKEKSVLPFFERHFFNAPTWIVDVPYINRILDNKEAYMEKLASSVMANLAGGYILEHLNSNYPVQEYLPELSGMVFKELNTKKSVTPYRRNLQRALVENLTDYFNSNKTNAGSDALAYTLLTLKNLKQRMLSASASGADAMTRAHYAQLADQIDRSLSKGQAEVQTQRWGMFQFDSVDNPAKLPTTVGQQTVPCF